MNTQSKLPTYKNAHTAHFKGTGTALHQFILRWEPKPSESRSEQMYHKLVTEWRDDLENVLKENPGEISPVEKKCLQTNELLVGLLLVQSLLFAVIIILMEWK